MKGLKYLRSLSKKGNVTPFLGDVNVFFFFTEIYLILFWKIRLLYIDYFYLIKNILTKEEDTVARKSLSFNVSNTLENYI